MESSNGKGEEFTVIKKEKMTKTNNLSNLSGGNQEDQLAGIFLEVRERLIKDLEREPFDEEIAAYLGISVSQVKKIKGRFKDMIKFGDPLLNNKEKERVNGTSKGQNEKIESLEEKPLWKEPFVIGFIIFSLISFIGYYFLVWPEKKLQNDSECILREAKRMAKTGIYPEYFLQKLPSDISKIKDLKLFIGIVKTIARFDPTDLADLDPKGMELVVKMRIILEKCGIKY